LNCKRIKDCILGTTAKTLGLGEDCFARFNYYPPCPRPDLVFGVKPHSDSSGVLTILLIDKDVSGLQVLRDGVWHNNVPASPFMLLINVGDFMEVPYSSIVLNYLYTVTSVMNCIFQQAVGLTTLTDADN
jgi:isopenicillin N synthase-like dioxygenase